MSSLTDSDQIFGYHRYMLKKHGKGNTLALGWRDIESQLVRFEVLAAIADMNNCSVLDAGCGYADLLPYLLNLYPSLKNYCGIDQIPELIDVAFSRYGNRPNTTFISGNFTTKALPKSDYILVNGSLNYTSSDPDFITKAIAKLYQSCTRALAFNLLRSVPIKGVLAAYDPEEILAFCRTLSTNVKLIDDYADEDFTIYLYH